MQCDWCPYKNREILTQTDTRGEHVRESEVMNVQLKELQQLQPLERQKKNREKFFLTAFRGSMAPKLWFRTSNPQDLKINLCSFKPPSSWEFIMQHQETNILVKGSIHGSKIYTHQTTEPQIHEAKTHRVLHLHNFVISRLLQALIHTVCNFLLQAPSIHQLGLSCHLDLTQSLLNIATVNGGCSQHPYSSSFTQLIYLGIA